MSNKPEPEGARLSLAIHDRSRVYLLARDLGLESAQVLAACHRVGIDAKNLLSSLSPADCEAIKRLVEREGPDTWPDAGTAFHPLLPRTPPKNGLGASSEEPT